ncbi:uncharacterized protein LOC131221716 [Magnolia sinica]|uniref:uncharacterized protein LOC131221716 n=1 Tax=Magnolia sinica TaxID=86752 RepID=UPI002658C676|nr:uncharacterized protein LOC131221716 [Magnolia sinica]
MAKYQFPKIPFFFFLLLSFLDLSSSVSIHDILRTNGLPPGILPKYIKSYTLHSSGALEVVLERPCLTKFDNRVLFDTVVKGNLSYAALTDLSGLSQEELFLWLPVQDIIVNDPSSGLILIDIGVAQKQLSLSLFEDPLVCKSDEEDDGSSRILSLFGMKRGRKEKGFEDQK